MQRILSMEAAGRSGALASEFITKRLCCSFILVVAFFGVIAGFLLGRFAGDQALHKVESEVNSVSQKVAELDYNLRMFSHRKMLSSGDDYFRSNIFNGSSNKCDDLRVSVPSADLTTSKRSTQEILNILNQCFGNG